MAKVSLQVKYLSNRNYIREISVEGKHTDNFFFSFGFYDDYVSQVIRAGNCLALLSSTFEITRHNFLEYPLLGGYFPLHILDI